MSRMITQSTKSFNGVSLNTPPCPNPVPYACYGGLPSAMAVLCVYYDAKGEAGEHLCPYTPEDVYALQRAVARNLPISHQFFCLSNDLDPAEAAAHGVATLPLLGSETGWWAKVNLFNTNIVPLDLEVLYLDLDVVVRNDLVPIVGCQGDLVMIENFGPNKPHAAHNSSVMRWRQTVDTAKIYDCFDSAVMDELHGDQCWIWRVMGDAIRDFPDDRVRSYKYHCRGKGPSGDVVVFHGQPKPHQVNEPWVRHYRR